METNKCSDKPLYSDYGKIWYYHGFIALAGYFALVVLGWFSLTSRWLWLGTKSGCAYNPNLCKTKPWWQDLGVLLVFCLTIVVLYAGWSQSILWGKLARWGAWIILFDIFVYYTRVLWFDDLKPQRNLRASMVWSPRRILFQSLISFTESVFLFTVIYHACVADGHTFWVLTRHSFTVATTLSAPKILGNCLTWVQVGFSLFIGVVVINILASVGYSRGEHAPSAKEKG